MDKTTSFDGNASACRSTSSLEVQIDLSILIGLVRVSTAQSSGISRLSFGAPLCSRASYCRESRASCGRHTSLCDGHNCVEHLVGLGRTSRRSFTMSSVWRSLSRQSGTLGAPVWEVRSEVVRRPLTNGSSEHCGSIFGGPRRESMFGINQLRFETAQPRVAQPHRYVPD